MSATAAISPRASRAPHDPRAPRDSVTKDDLWLGACLGVMAVHFISSDVSCVSVVPLLEEVSSPEHGRQANFFVDVGYVGYVC